MTLLRLYPILSFSLVLLAIVATAANSNDGQSRARRQLPPPIGISPCHTTAPSIEPNRHTLLRWWLKRSARAALWSRRRRREPFGRAGRPLSSGSPLNVPWQPIE